MINKLITGLHWAVILALLWLVLSNLAIQLNQHEWLVLYKNSLQNQEARLVEINAIQKKIYEREYSELRTKIDYKWKELEKDSGFLEQQLKIPQLVLDEPDLGSLLTGFQHIQLKVKKHNSALGLGVSFDCGGPPRFYLANVPEIINPVPGQRFATRLFASDTEISPRIDSLWLNGTACKMDFGAHTLVFQESGLQPIHFKAVYRSPRTGEQKEREFTRYVNVGE
jgi:hypothetical protein